MLTGIDHLAVAFSDLDEAVNEYTQRGFAVVEGGKHPTGTHNALIALADGSYIELVAFYEPNAEHPWWPKLQQGGGLIDFCLRTDDLEADISVFRRAGINMSDATPGSRTRPDGYNIQWLLSMPSPEHRGVIPFLIEDVTPREERVPRETEHRNNVIAIRTLTIVVDDLQIIRRQYSNLLQNGGQEIENDDEKYFGVRFLIGAHQFDFVAPRGLEGPLDRRLRNRGPSPYAATLTTNHEDIFITAS